MALNDVTITFDLNQLLGGDFERNAVSAYVKTNVANQTLIDTSTGEIRLGQESVTIGADGTGSFTTWGVGADGNPTSWQTSLVVSYRRGRERPIRTFGPYTITDADNGKNLAELEDQQAIPPDYQSAFVADMEAIRDEAEAARDAAVDISSIDTSDGVVSTLIEGTAGAGPLTRSALSASTADSISGTVDSGLTPQEAVDGRAAALVGRLRFDDLTKPYTIAHQSTPKPYPGHTDIGYRYAIAHGFPVLDLDAQLTADEVLINLHDATVDGVTASTGAINTYDYAILGALPMDPQNYLAPGWGNVATQYLSGISETLTRYGTRLLYTIEAKSGSLADVQRIVDICTDLAMTEQVLVQSTSLASLAPAAAAGMRCAQITNSPDATAMLAAGVEYVVPVYTVGSASLASMIASGLKPIPYGINRQYDHNALAAIAGMEAIISDDPLYSSNGAGWRKTATQFDKKVRVAGHQPAQGEGTFSASNSRLNFAAGSNTWDGLYQLRPVGDSLTGKTITFTATFDTVGASASAYLGLHICAPDDRPYTNNASSSGYRDGYRVVLQANGSFQIHKVTAGGTVTAPIPGAAVAAAVPTDGTSVTITVQVTATQIIASIPAQSKTATATDSDFRGGVIHCGQNGNGGAFASSFASVSVA